MKPWMSEKDIADMYLGAVNPAKQIKVLAELNACSKGDIEKILVSRGVVLPELKEHKCKGVKKKYWSIPELLELLQLNESGMSRKKLAEHFGRSEIAVRNILTKMNPAVVSVPPRNIAKALEIYNKSKGVMA